MKKWKMLFIIGALVIIQGLFVGTLCANPYPCGESGVGCASVWQAYTDSWASYYLGFSLIIGLAIIIKGVKSK